MLDLNEVPRHASPFPALDPNRLIPAVLDASFAKPANTRLIVAFDFFTVPTLTFQLLYCFFVIEHGRRKILHFNLTRHPRAEWVVQ